MSTSSTSNRDYALTFIQCHWFYTGIFNLAFILEEKCLRFTTTGGGWWLLLCGNSSFGNFFISTASSDSSFSFHLNSSLDDVLSIFSSSQGSASYQKDDFVSGMVFDVIGSEEIDPGNSSSIWVKNQSPVDSGNLSADGNASSLPRRKRNLNVQVPKRQFHNDDDFFQAPNSSKNYPNLSPRCHSRIGKSHSESPCNWPNYGKQQSFPLPLPPTSTSISSPPFSHSSLAATSSLPHSPGRMESKSSGSYWKKGKLLGRGEYGYAYMGFNSETGDMCAMKEVSFSPDDDKSTQTFKQMVQEIQLLSCLKHPNIVQYYCSEVIAWQSSPLLHKDNLYWMAPDFIRNPNVCNQAVDIWSLGCTVVEMATSKPPWSQYGEVVAMFKIVNSKELPVIPDYLSDECKDFVRQCLQWNPLQRPTAAQLLEHPFLMKSGVSLGNQVFNSTLYVAPATAVIPIPLVLLSFFSPIIL